MSIITEDGTGRADAESFITLADATTYHSDRGNASKADLLAQAKAIVAKMQAHHGIA